MDWKMLLITAVLFIVMALLPYEKYLKTSLGMFFLAPKEAGPCRTEPNQETFFFISMLVAIFSSVFITLKTLCGMSSGTALACVFGLGVVLFILLILFFAYSLFRSFLGE